MSDVSRAAELAEALQRVADQDVTAFHLIYDRTASKLFAICLRICGDRSAAEDVLHEVYLTIWRRAGAYDPLRGGAMAWLATTARNRAIDWRRSRATRPTSPLELAPDFADSAPLASEAMMANEDLRALHGCLDELEERTRTVIRRAFFDGLTYSELAASFEVPLGTMKSWIRRGLLRLKECLGRDG